MVEVRSLELGDCVLLRGRRFHDNRGWFCETFREDWFRKLGWSPHFVQDNMSWSEHAWTLRGLHAQRNPFAQAKLISVISGAIFDVIVDCRKDSPTFGMWRSLELSAEEPEFLFIPRGFCHGFLTLKPSTTVFYKADNVYSAEHEIGLRWDDPVLNIPWPLKDRAVTVSDKDRTLPSLAELVPL